MVRFLSDDRHEKGNKELQVIAAGLPRCATSSMQAALESKWLNFGPSLHMARVFPWPEREQMVIDAMNEPDSEKRQKILRRLVEGYGATTDFPGCGFVDDLMDMYPNAKVILNQRQNAEVWVDSFWGALGWFESWQYRFVGFLWQTDRKMWYMHGGLLKYIPLKTKSNHVLYSTKTYNAWLEFVREECRKRDRPLLEWQPGDGWEPICSFLRKPTPPPEVPFPRTNDRREMQIMKTVLVVRGLLAWALLAALIYTTLTFGPRILGM